MQLQLLLEEQVYILPVHWVDDLCSCLIALLLPWATQVSPALFAVSHWTLSQVSLAQGILHSLPAPIDPSTASSETLCSNSVSVTLINPGFPEQALPGFLSARRYLCRQTDRFTRSPLLTPLNLFPDHEVGSAHLHVPRACPRGSLSSWPNPSRLLLD
jgi:hypothetical protein